MNPTVIQTFTPTVLNTITGVARIFAVMVRISNNDHT